MSRGQVDPASSRASAQLLGGVTQPVLQRAFWYLRNVDENLGDRVEKGVRAARPQPSPVPPK